MLVEIDDDNMKQIISTIKYFKNPTFIDFDDPNGSNCIYHTIVCSIVNSVKLQVEAALKEKNEHTD